MHHKLNYAFDKPIRTKGLAVHSNTYTVETRLGPQKRYEYLLYKRGKPSKVLIFRTFVQYKAQLDCLLAPRMNENTGRQVSRTIVRKDKRYNLPVYMDCVLHGGTDTARQSLGIFSATTV